METMRLTEKKKSSKGVVIGLLFFFIIGGTILYFGLKMESEPEVVGTSTDNTETQSLVDVDKANKDELTKKNQSIEYSVTDKSIKDSSNTKMKANMTLPVISIESEELSSINSEINKYYTDMFNSLKEQMASASSKYTYTVTYNVYENMIEENKEGLNSIGNIVLLVLGVNRSYRNNPHNEKMDRIISEFLINGRYIRPHTFNVFTSKIKSIDENGDNTQDLYWSQEDMIRTVQDIEKRLVKYLNIE